MSLFRLNGLADKLKSLCGIVKLCSFYNFCGILVILTSEHCVALLQSITSTPMLRAVPATMLIAVSREAALRSGILSSAIF